MSSQSSAAKQSEDGDALIGAAWWCVPDLLMLFFLMPLALLCLTTGHKVLSADGVRDYITLANGTGVMALLLAYASGAYFGRKTQFLSLATVPVPDLYMDIMFLLTLLAYVIWFAPVLIDFNVFASILAGVPGAAYDVRSQLQTTPGVTTFTQAGVAYVCLYVGAADHEPAPRRRHIVFLVVIVSLGLLRAFLRSERLAVLELIIPLIISYALRHRRSKMVAFGPFIGILVLYGFFAVTEYFRSWVSFYANKGGSLSSFVIERIQDYYLFSLNNGLGLVDSQAQGTSPALIYFSLDWLYKFPIVGPMIVSNFHITDPGLLYLNRFADPELNSFAEVVALICDFGWLGALMAATLIGVITGLSFQSMVSREGLLRFYYPVLFIGALEFIRVNYLSTGRTFPIYILLLAPFLFSGRGALRGKSLTAAFRR